MESQVIRSAEVPPPKESKGQLTRFAREVMPAFSGGR